MCGGPESRPRSLRSRAGFPVQVGRSIEASELDPGSTTAFNGPQLNPSLDKSNKPLLHKRATLAPRRIRSDEDLLESYAFRVRCRFCYMIGADHLCRLCNEKEGKGQRERRVGALAVVRCAELGCSPRVEGAGGRPEGAVFLAATP